MKTIRIYNFGLHLQSIKKHCYWFIYESRVITSDRNTISNGHLLENDLEGRTLFHGSTYGLKRLRFIANKNSLLFKI